MMHHRSQRYGHNGGGIVNPFRGGSSRLTYADPRYNKIGGGPNGGGGGSPRNLRWHSSSAGKCAVLAVTILFLSYSTFFAPAPPATPNKSLTSGGTTPTSNGLLSSTINNKKATYPQTSPAATDGTKASLLQPPTPAQPIDSQFRPNKDAALADPALTKPAERLEEGHAAVGGGAGGKLADGGGEGSGSREGPVKQDRFGSEDPEVEADRGVSFPDEKDAEAEGGAEEDEDDDFAGDGRPPEMMMAKKKRIHPGDDNQAEDEDDDGQTGEGGGETGGSNEGEGDGDTKSMFQGGDDNSPGGKAAAPGDRTSEKSMEVPVIKDTNGEIEPLLTGSGEANGNDFQEADAAGTDPGDVPAGDHANVSKDAAIDSEDNGTVGGSELAPPEATTAAANGGSKDEIPVVIPLPRDSKAAAVDAGLPAPGADKEGSPEAAGPGDREEEGGDSTSLQQPAGDNEEGEGQDFDASKDSDGRSGTEIDGLNPALPNDANETEHGEVETTKSAESNGEVNASDPTPSTPETGEAVLDAPGDVNEVKGGPELAEVDSPQQEVDERHIADEGETSTTTGSNDKPSEGALAINDALSTGSNDTAKDELAKDLNDTIVNPSEPDVEADSEQSKKEAKLGDIPESTEGDQESSPTALEGGKSGNDLLLQENADAATADKQVESAEVGIAIALEDGDSPKSKTADEKPKKEVPLVADSNGSTVDNESQERRERDSDATPDRQHGGNPKKENESPASDVEIEVTAEGSKQGDEPADGNEASNTIDIHPDSAKETELKLPSDIAAENGHVTLQATSGEEADTEVEIASKRIGDTTSKSDPVAVPEGSGEANDTTPGKKDSELVDSRKKERDELVNDTSTETDKNDPDPSEPESSPIAKKGKKRKGDATAVEVDPSATIDGEDNEGVAKIGKDEETTKESRRRKEAADKEDNELPDAKNEAAELDEADAAKETRTTKDKAKSHLRGANKDVEKADRY